MTDKNLGHATAYGYAKSKGYTGTEEEFAELMASYAEVASDAKGYADDAEQSATDAEQNATNAQQSATDAEQFAQQAKESAESIDMSSFATKAELSSFESEASQTYATSESLSAVNDELNDTKVALNDAIEDFAVPTQEAVDNWLNEHPEATTSVQDGSITIPKLASDTRALISRGAISEAVKQALLNIFAHVAYIDADGQTYIDALEDALYPPANLISITAIFNQADNTIYDSDSLDTLKQYLTVTAYYDDGTNRVVTDYSLSGLLNEKTSTITVSYEDRKTTFMVDVTMMRLLNNDDIVSYIGASAVNVNNNGELTYTAKYTGEKYLCILFNQNIVRMTFTLTALTRKLNVKLIYRNENGTLSAMDQGNVTTVPTSDTTRGRTLTVSDDWYTITSDASAVFTPADWKKIFPVGNYVAEIKDGKLYIYDSNSNVIASVNGANAFGIWGSSYANETPLYDIKVNSY